ncbi:MAG: thiamine diphosphokinase [Pseudomonadota bacterium]
MDTNRFSRYILAMNYLIIASGELGDSSCYAAISRSAERVICADGGVRHARALNLVPHIVIGDLDSLDDRDALFLEQKAVRIIRHPVDKDATDSELAVSWAMENGASTITLIGAMGKRMDHTLANILLLKQMADKGISGCVMDGNNEIYLVSRSLTLAGKPGDYLSIIPVTETVTDVTLTGLAFPLIRASMTLGSTLGVSNRFVGSTATVSVGHGILVVSKSRDLPVTRST